MLKVICTSIALLAGLSAQAIDFIQTDQFSIPDNEVLTDETWISAQAVTISGTASNDLFATAPVIELNGIFHGDVWSGGDSIRAAGIFKNDVRLMARTTQVFGTVYGSLLTYWPTPLIASTVKIDRTANIYGDVQCTGVENAIIEGSIVGNVRIEAKRVTLGGKIDGDVSIVAQDIIVLPNTILNGNLNYVAPDELVFSSAVILNGELTRDFISVPRPFLIPNLITHSLFGFAALLAGLFFFRLFPNYTSGAVLNLNTMRGFCLLTGSGGLFMLPAAALLLLSLIIVGWPLSALILLFYGILLYLSKIVVAVWIGMLIFRRHEMAKRAIAAPLALGLFIIYALSSIFALNIIINVMVAILGLGALLIGLFKKPVLILQTPNAINETNKEG